MRRWMVVFLVTLTAAGCGSRSRSDGNCANPPDLVQMRAVEIPSRGPVDLVTDAPGAHLVVQLKNDERTAQRVRLSFAGEEALDVDLPASLDCGYGGFVYSFAYDDWPPGPVEVRLDLQGSTSTSTVDVPATGTVWAVVNVQSEREWGNVTTYDTRPGWG